MWRVFTFSVWLLIIVESRGEYDDQETESRKIADRSFDAADVLGKVKRGEENPAGFVPTSTLIALRDSFHNCMSRFSILRQIPKEVLTKEWNISSKDEDWFKKNKCFMYINDVIRYIREPELRTDLDDKMQIYTEADQCQSKPDGFKQSIIQMFSDMTCDGTDVKYRFNNEEEYIKTTMELMDKRCQRQIERKKELETFETSVSLDRKRDTDYVAGVRQRRHHGGAYKDMSTDGFQAIMELASCLAGQGVPFIREGKRCKRLYTEIPKYVNALVSGEKEKAKSHEGIFEQRHADYNCFWLRLLPYSMDPAYQSSGTLLQQFLSANINFVSGMKEFIYTVCPNDVKLEFKRSINDSQVFDERSDVLELKSPAANVEENVFPLEERMKEQASRF